jgi:nucleotidyltransferase/DNA polymerase involved in DNA repair
VALLAIALGSVLLLGGRNLRKMGTDASKRTREQGIFALASHRGGILRASDVAQALGIPEEEADAELTTLAKQKSDQVSLELDEDGPRVEAPVEEQAAREELAELEAPVPPVHGQGARRTVPG